MAPLGSYNVILRMNWLREHKVVVDCFSKNLECLDDLGNRVCFQGIKHRIKVRQIFAMQMKQCKREGCQMFAINLEEVQGIRKTVYHDDMMMYDATRHSSEGLPQKDKEQTFRKGTLICKIIKMYFQRNW